MAHFRFQLVTLLFAVAVADLSAQNAPYVVPANSSGVIVKSGDDYPDKIQMSGSDGVYTLEKQQLGTGFVFLGVSSSSAELYSVYSIPAWAVKPAITGYENPLQISGNEIIAVTPGQYDITFYDRDKSGAGYHMFVIVPSDRKEERFFPPAMYVIAGSSVTKAEQLPDTAGVYTVDMNMPSQMRISYEPKILGTFVYGPAASGSNLLTSGSDLPLAYKANTSVMLRPDPAVSGKELLKEGERVSVRIDLRDAVAPVLRVTNESTQAIGEVAADQIGVIVSGGHISVRGNAGYVKELYTPQGTCLYRGEDGDMGSYPSGIYILRVGSKVCKIALSH